MSRVFERKDLNIELKALELSYVTTGRDDAGSGSSMMSSAVAWLIQY
jgi:hypothetical protein